MLCLWLFVTPWTLCHHAPLYNGDSPRQEYWGGLPCSRDLPNPGMEPRSPTLQVDSLPPEPPGEPKHTGVGSLALLQGIFPTQESNWGPLHCRWTLYQLRYQGSPESSLSQVETFEFLAMVTHSAVSVLSFWPTIIWARWYPVMGPWGRTTHQQRLLSGPGEGLLWTGQQFLCQIRFKHSMIPKLLPGLSYFRTGEQPTK